MSATFKSIKILTHVKCVGNNYSTSKVKRQTIPENYIPWSVPWPEYNPPEYNSKVLLNKPWADSPIGQSGYTPRFNALDGQVNRVSYTGEYKVVDGYPLNPVGRTGIVGRGVLGRWGPNHAADPIVTRWKRSETGSVITQEQKPVLEICLIQRHDCGEWALPGGMVDPGETVVDTAKREFMEEALNSLQKDKGDLFANGRAVYTGYVDDPRNTDNAWMETSAFHYHDSTGDGLGAIALCAGDDAKNVQWTTVDRNLKLYASHGMFVKEVIDFLNAYW